MMHPIRFDYDDAKPFLTKYQPVFEKVLNRQEGRAPDSHYATLLYIGRKK